MTERGARHVTQSADSFTVGPSALHWTGSALEISIDEMTTPHLQRLRGTIRLHPAAITDVEVPLHHDESHIWRPFAPTARVEVDLGRDVWRWQGHGYFDANFGTAALEDDFSYWTWARLPYRGGTASFYDATRRDGSALAVALDFGPDGAVRALEPPPKAAMPRNLWAIRRETRADAGATPRVVQPMLDAPFYSRAMLRTSIPGAATVGVHEALDLNRLRNPVIRAMLACRMPRVG